MQESEIFSKTDAGRDEIRTRALHLPGAIRAILLMVDGQRTIAQFRDIIAGSKAPPDTLDTLLSQGLIESRIDPSASIIDARTPEASPPEAAKQAPLPTGEAAPPLTQPEAPSPAAVPIPNAASTAPVKAAMPAAVSRYDRLYAMMSEVVHDFLPAHRRYFIQLKIEKCSTAEELLELLHELRTVIAKAKGEAFAADIIARMRSAAN